MLNAEATNCQQNLALGELNNTLMYYASYNVTGVSCSVTEQALIKTLWEFSPCLVDAQSGTLVSQCHMGMGCRADCGERITDQECHLGSSWDRRQRWCVIVNPRYTSWGLLSSGQWASSATHVVSCRASTAEFRLFGLKTVRCAGPYFRAMSEFVQAAGACGVLVMAPHFPDT